MIDGLRLGLAGLAGGVLGVLLGGWLVWRLVGARLDAWGRSWLDAPQRIRQDLQQALRVELDFLARQQAQRDAALAQRAQEHAMALRALVDGPPAMVATVAAASAAIPVAVPRSVPARPLERSSPPLPQPVPVPVHDEPESSRELSDEELDALPPELPVPDRSRKRMLPAPKKPALQRL